MKIFNSNTLKDIDRHTCEVQAIDSIELMERAADAISCEIIALYPMNQRMVVIAGPGNNGGDALAVARKLLEQGYRNIEVYLFNINQKLSYDCEQERQRLLPMEGVNLIEVVQQFRPPRLGKGDVVIDGLFGAGLSQPLQGGFKSVAKYVNESGASVISIDCPSGLFGEWNAQVADRNAVMHADITFTLHSPRLSFLFEENAQAVGRWQVLDIDLEEPADTPFDFSLVEERNVRSQLRQRLRFSAKRDYGSVLIFAGSMGMMGAAVMSARGALKAGAGLVTVHSARCGLVTVQTAFPEAMFEPDRNERFITDMTVHHDHQVIVAGPGIGTNNPTIEALQRLLRDAKSPLILDADALNCISQCPQMLAELPHHTVLTPHVGEFDRLFGEQPSSEQRLRTAIEQAKRLGITIVLKGHYTAVVRPTGRVYFNSTGNPGMATAGSGDVLSGIIAAFIAQGYRPDLAATLGVYVHGLAGDLAAKELGQFGLVASDIADYAGRAIMQIIRQ